MEDKETELFYCNKCKTLTFKCPGCGKFHHVERIKLGMHGNVELISREGCLIAIPYSEVKKAEEHFGISNKNRMKPRCHLDWRKLCLHPLDVINCYEGKFTDCQRLRERKHA